MNKNLAQAPAFFNPEYHDLIGLIYDSATSGDGFRPFLQRFMEVFGGHSASFAIYDTKNNVPLGYWVVNIPEHALVFYIDNVAHQDVLVETAMAVRQRDGLRFVATNLDIENIEEVGRATRADEWLASFGARIAAGAIAFHSDTYLNFFGMQRSESQPDFSREELAVFDQFLPHINRAAELYTKMGELKREHIPERSALNQVQQGILIFDTTFKVVFKNRTADDVIANNKGLRLNEDGMFSFHEKEFSREFIISLSEAVRASLESTEQGEAVLCYCYGGQNLTVIVSPLATGKPGSGESSNRGGAMINLYDWANRPSVSPEQLQRFFGLSRAEARVSAFLLSGHSTSDIAEQLNRSRETVKSHLQAIYRKTNTSRQGELVALLSASSGVA